MIDIQLINLDYLKELKKNDILSIFLEDKETKQLYLQDYFKIDKTKMDDIDLLNVLKEIYYYNHVDNDIYSSTLFKENELTDRNYMLSKNIII